MQYCNVNKGENIANHDLRRKEREGGEEEENGERGEGRRGKVREGVEEEENGEREEKGEREEREKDRR